jgi:iron(III) transport system substrate-binding protein
MISVFKLETLMKKINLTGIFILLVLTLILTSCAKQHEEINVYSARHYRSDEVLFKSFTARTGIRVNLIKGDSDQLINRLVMEGKNSPADIFITADAGRIGLAVEQGILQPMKFEGNRALVPDHMRDEKGLWIGLTQRARVIVYHKDRVSPSELSTYGQLTDAKWKGRILSRSSQSNYNQTLLASIIAANGYDAALKWAQGLVENFARPPQGNDRDQVKAVAAGVGDLAIVNTYYMGLLLRSSNSEERRVAEQMKIFFPNQNDRGSHINVSAMGVTVSSNNKDNAIKLIDYLLEKSSQEYLASENFEHPIRTDAKWPELLKDWGDFNGDKQNLTGMSSHIPDAMRIFDIAGWD